MNNNPEQPVLQDNNNNNGNQDQLNDLIKVKIGLIENLNFDISLANESCQKCLNDQDELHKQILTLNREKNQNNSQNTKAEEKIMNFLSSLSQFLESKP